MKITYVAAAAALLICFGLRTDAQSASRAAGSKNAISARSVISQKLPAMNGSSLRIIIERVNFPPGVASPAHTHPCPVIGYVTEGEFQSQVAGSKMETYAAGQTFYEPPNGIHQVSRSASRSRPAQILAIFVCDKATPLTLPAPARPKH